MELLILKGLDNGSLKYEHLLTQVEQKLVPELDIKNPSLEWEIDFFKNYAVIAEDTAKVVEFLKNVNIDEMLGNFTAEGKLPYEMLKRYVDVLKTVKTLSSTKRFQNNKALKNEMKTLLGTVRSHCDFFTKLYRDQLESIELNDNMRSAMESNIKQLKTL